MDPSLLVLLLSAHATNAFIRSPPASPIPDFELRLKQFSRWPTFVDKSRMVTDFVRAIDNGTDFIYLTAPVGFGKTINLQLLRRFLELALHMDNSLVRIKTPSQRTNFFEHFKHQPFYEKHFALHPVVYVSFRNISSNHLNETIEQIAFIIRKLYKRHYPLYERVLNMKRSPTIQLDFYYQIANVTVPTVEALGRSLRFLCLLMRYFYELDTIVLIDDYDYPVYNAIVKNAGIVETHRIMHTMVSILRDYAKYVVMTGTSQLIAVDVNAARKPFLRNHEFWTDFGFLEDEVKQILQRNNCQHEEDYVRNSYGGYEPMMSSQFFLQLYSPLDIVKYIETKQPPEHQANYLNFLSGILLETDALREKILRLVLNRWVELPLHLDGTSLERLLHFVKITRRKGAYINHTNGPDYITDTAELYYTLLYENGYFSCAPQSGLRYICRAPNTKMRIQFEQNVEAFYKARGIPLLSNPVASYLHYLVHIKNTPPGRRTQLADQLTALFQPYFNASRPIMTLTEFEFRSVISLVAKYNFQDVRVNVTAQNLGFERTINPHDDDYRVDLAIYSVRHPIVVLIDIAYRRDDAVERHRKLCKYRPHSIHHTVQHQIYVIKYLTVSMNVDNLVRIEYTAQQYNASDINTV